MSPVRWSTMESSTCRIQTTSGASPRRRTGDLIWENPSAPGLQAAGQAPRAISPSIRTKFSSPLPTRTWWRSTPAPAKSFGTPLIADNQQGHSNSSGPIVIRGKVCKGLSGCDRYKARKASKDASSAPLIPHGQAPLEISTLWLAKRRTRWRHLGRLPNMLRAGGETWITGSYDPELNLTYWGVAQAKPWMRSAAAPE